MAAYHGAGLWHPIFVKGRNSREVDPGRGKENPTIGKAKAPKGVNVFSVKKPTIGETDVQAKSKGLHVGSNQIQTGRV